MNVKSLLWDCKVCHKKGNYQNFLEQMNEMYISGMDTTGKQRLAQNRGLPVEAFRKWGVGKNGTMYSIPIYNFNGKLQDLRTYRLGKKVMSSPACVVGLMGLDKLVNEPKEYPIYVCEGEWDGMALSWLLDSLKIKASIVSVPGAGTFKKEWIPHFKDRNVMVMYDNDEAGENGEHVVRERLYGVAKTIKYLHWPVRFPAGYDLRDFITSEAVKGKRPRRTIRLLGQMLRDNPRKGVPNVATTTEEKEAKPLAEPFKIDRTMTIEKVYATFKKWMHITNTDPIEVAIATMASNKLKGDPLWMFIVAPPGGSKTEILSAFDKCPSVYITSSLTPHALISGAAFKNGVDPSLIPQLDGKTLIVKDFTSIMGKRENEKEEIFSILRDAYDGKCGKVFGTGTHRHYVSHFTILSGVTGSIYELGNQYAALGERFLKFYIGDNLRHMAETDIIRRACLNVNNELNMRDELSNAVASYIHLIYERMDSPDFKTPKIPERILRKLVSLAQWGARMRGIISREKYTTDMIIGRPSAEVGSRLGKNLIKLAYSLAIANMRNEVNDRDFEIVKKAMVDTISQRNDDILKSVYQACPTIDDSIDTMSIVTKTKYTRTTVSRVLDDMNLLHIVKKLGRNNKYAWTMSDYMRKLIESAELYKKKPTDIQ